MENELTEILPIVDAEGNVIGRASRSVCHDGVSMKLHPVVHLHLYDRQRGLLLQKRSLKKRIQPGYRRGRTCGLWRKHRDGSSSGSS